MDSKLNIWLRAIGFYRAFFIVSFIPASTGLLLALNDGHTFSFINFALALSGVWAFHIGTNLINDYYDYVFKTDVVNRVQTPFSGGTRVIIDGLLRPAAVRNVAIAWFFIGFVPLGILSYLTGIPILILALIGSFSGWFYSAPPFKFAYRGLGELFIGLNFGPFILATAFYSQARTFTPDALFVSLIIGLFSFAIITVNEFPDYEADRETGKRNLVVRLGLGKGVLLYRAIVYSAFGLVLIGLALHILPAASAISLLLIPKVNGIAARLSASPQDVPAMTASSAGTIQTFTVIWLLLSAGLIYELWRGAA
jgi:1,4-dihydroxy-2-naphthoate octaprenyltransferase